ncbi:MAG: hypothetical protein AAF223_14385, partial [Bacteroidota bacterium]
GTVSPYDAVTYLPLWARASYWFMLIVWQKELDEDLELVKNYIDWKASGHPDLKEWGIENNKKVEYRFSRSYYYKK